MSQTLREKRLKGKPSGPKHWLAEKSRRHIELRDNELFTIGTGMIDAILRRTANPVEIQQMFKAVIKRVKKTGDPVAFNAIMDRLMGKARQTIDLNMGLATVREDIDMMREGLLNDPAASAAYAIIGERMAVIAGHNGQPSHARALPPVESSGSVREGDPGDVPDAKQPPDDLHAASARKKHPVSAIGPRRGI